MKNRKKKHPGKAPTYTDAAMAAALFGLLCITRSADAPWWVWYLCFPLVWLVPALAYRRFQERPMNIWVFALALFLPEAGTWFYTYLYGNGQLPEVVAGGLSLGSVPLFVKVASGAAA